MISMKELLCGNILEEQSEEIQANLAELLEKINQVRAAYGIPMTVTSSLRTMAHHLEIYAAKGITDPTKIPMRSRHLYGQAVDIADGDGKLREWVLANLDLMESIGMWFEALESTPNWVHFQIVPYGSYKEGGSLFFKP
jgi:uncharacterized protein YcbK (DUF882 family)